MGVGFLAFASLFFFGWWRPDYLIILLGSMAVNYGFGRALLSGRHSDRVTGAILTIGVSLNLALLGYYKYAGFFVQNANDFFGAGWNIPSILLPIGISFFLHFSKSHSSLMHAVVPSPNSRRSTIFSLSHFSRN